MALSACFCLPSGADATFMGLVEFSGNEPSSWPAEVLFQLDEG